MLPAIEAAQVPELADLKPIPPGTAVPEVFGLDAALLILGGEMVTWPDGARGFVACLNSDRDAKLCKTYRIARQQLEAAAMAAPANTTH